MSAPPWIFSCIFSVAVSWNADRTQEKARTENTRYSFITDIAQFWHITGPILVGIVGFIISMVTLNAAARYVALFLQAGSYAGFIVFFSWISSSFPRPPAKRAVAIAMVNAFGQLGNISGAYVWHLDENGYRGSYGIVLSMFCVAILGCFVFRTMLSRLNRNLQDAEMRQIGQQPGANIHGSERLQMRKGFRYLV